MGEDRRRKRPDFAADANPLAVAMAEQERQTLAMVQQALKSGRMRLAYQPVVLAADPRRIAFYEGLIRILDETGRVIPARDFMPVAESRELGREIDCAALDLGVQALVRHPGLRLAINMSARSIGYPRWRRVLQQGLARGPTLGERLILEITESSAMLVPEIVTAFMEEVQASGVAFALDDFGAGYTAFRHFRDFFFDIVKIDGQFIRGIQSDPDNQVLTRALVAIGQQFQMLTIAEAVETPEEAQILQQIGVDCLQGYLFGAPELKPGFLTDARRKRA